MDRSLPGRTERAPTESARQGWARDRRSRRRGACPDAQVAVARAAGASGGAASGGGAACGYAGGFRQLRGHLRQEAPSVARSSGLERREQGVVEGEHRVLEPGDQVDAGGGGVHALRPGVRRRRPSFDEAASLEPLQEARDAGRAGPGHLGDVPLDGAGVLLQVPEHEALLVGELALTHPVLGGLALGPPDPAHELEGCVEVRCLHDQNSNCLNSNCQRARAHVRGGGVGPP